MIKALFLDRDGTLIVDKHYQKDAHAITYLPHIFEALALFKKNDYELFIVTNQSGIARGLLNLHDVNLIHQKMNADLLSHSIPPFADIALCPHAPDDHCLCRKPSPKMILDLAQKWDVDLSQSFMVGDKESDIEAGKNAGTKTFLITKTDSLYTLACDLFK
ncbi:MAG: HAD family hydrolase [Bacteriovoracaceae bacterium]|nr:HAD family hydrolase [Bacteriovoracaceae bacterium]